jgi:Sap, sulfolipid-1-addressing protein
MSTFVLFVILGVSTHLLIIAAAALFPQATRGPLDRCLRWLQRNNRAIMIALGLGFGSWFLYKGLHGLGIL